MKKRVKQNGNPKRLHKGARRRVARRFSGPSHGSGGNILAAFAAGYMLSEWLRGPRWPKC